MIRFLEIVIIIFFLFFQLLFYLLILIDMLSLLTGKLVQTGIFKLDSSFWFLF